MNLTVIGLTTEPSKISAMLGVKNENQYGLYQETAKGKYFARFLPDGTMDSRLVRLVTGEQASEIEANALANIESMAKKIQKIANSVPDIDLEGFHRNMENLKLSVRAIAAQIGRDVRRTSELYHSL